MRLHDGHQGRPVAGIVNGCGWLTNQQQSVHWFYWVTVPKEPAGGITSSRSSVSCPGLAWFQGLVLESQKRPDWNDWNINHSVKHKPLAYLLSSAMYESICKSIDLYLSIYLSNPLPLSYCYFDPCVAVPGRKIWVQWILSRLLRSTHQAGGQDPSEGDGQDGMGEGQKASTREVISTG